MVACSERSLAIFFISIVRVVGRRPGKQNNVPAFRRALDSFNAAVDADPHYARAYAGID
jgi:hypothetical protein